MGKSIGTCGHELPFDWERSGAAQIAVREHDQEGNRAIAYQTVCRDCRIRYADAGQLLATEPQREHWLKGDPRRR
jgi:hypothetical protein